MAGYYAYIFGHDGHITCRVEIVCRDDEMAVERAKQLVDGHDVELWRRDRRIATFQGHHGVCPGAQNATPTPPPNAISPEAGT